MPKTWSALAPKILTAAGFIVIVAALHLGQSLFVPLAFAILLAMILAPLAGLGERMYLPRALSAVAVVAAAFTALALAGLLVAGEATTLAKKFPEYRSNILAKVESLRVPSAKKLKEIRESIKDVQTAVTPPGEEPAPKAPEDPVKVEVVDNPLSPVKIATAIWGSLVAAAAVLSVVVLLTIFFLIYRTEILDRIIRLGGDAQVQMTTQTITEASRGVSRFLFAQALVNASHGCIVGVFLFAMGVPGALLWGVLAAVLRFVPYVGPITAGALPVLLSIAVFPGWTKPLLVAGFTIALEIVVNNVVEPLAYGRRSGLTPLAVVLAAVFWAWLWGAAGLILAVPLTVCLVSLGKYVPSLQFLAVAFGDEPALDPKLQVYRRLLGPHPVEAAELLERELAGGKSLAALYDNVVLPVVGMVESDVRQGKLEESKARQLFATLREIVDELAESARAKPAPEETMAACNATVLCIPASTRADMLSAHMLTQVLDLRGCPAKSLEIGRMAGETMEDVLENGPDILVICISLPSNLLRARYLYKRLRRRFGDRPVVQGVWGGGDSRAIEGRIAPDGKATMVSSFVEAEMAIGDLSREASQRNRLKDNLAAAP